MTAEVLLGALLLATTTVVVGAVALGLGVALGLMARFAVRVTALAERLAGRLDEGRRDAPGARDGRGQIVDWPAARPPRRRVGFEDPPKSTERPRAHL